MDKSIWKETIRENANKKGMKLHNKCQEGVCTKKRKGIPAVERRERGGKGVCKRTTAKGIYSAIEVTANSTGILCREER